MKLRSVEEIPSDIRVILRMDLDLPKGDNSRMLKSVPTIRYLLERNCKILIIGHIGRPKDHEESLSLKPIYLDLMSILGEVDGIFCNSFDEVPDKQIVFYENLRFWEGEENNNNGFLRPLIEQSQAYVNDAFAVAHRKHASIMLHQVMDAYYGFSFVEEAEQIAKVLENPEKPITIILGGAKEDKMKNLPELEKIVDHILIGGKLPTVISYQSEKIVVGDLDNSGFDINEDTINRFTGIIEASRTIIWVGSMGLYENVEHQNGTKRIAQAVANNPGFKIIAGGDTAAAIKDLGLKDKIDYICSGGGVMLEYLSKGQLPAWLK